MIVCGIIGFKLRTVVLTEKLFQLMLGCHANTLGTVFKNLLLL